MLMAVRKLNVRTADSEVSVEVRLFKPINDEGMWVCNYEIEWPDRTKKMFGAGVDAIQAIQTALNNIGIQLYTSEYHKNGQLSWTSAGGGYGFPLAKNVRDLSIGNDLDL
jgi:hypothetical protein